MSEDRPLPSTVMGQELLSQLKKAPEQTLYGLALSGQMGIVKRLVFCVILYVSSSFVGIWIKVNLKLTV